MIDKLFKNLHPNSKAFFNSNNGYLIELLDSSVKQVIEHRKRENTKIVPGQPEQILNCFSVDIEKIKVVIIGQDPYPQPGVATGDAFVCLGKHQPSLQILIRELEKEYGLNDLALSFDGSLQSWKDQGILLLNSSLSCDEFKPGSHTNYWKSFMESLVKELSDLKLSRESMDSIVFVLLGKQAQSFKPYINADWHYIIERFHPAAETYGANKFIGFFKETNYYLCQHQQSMINWFPAQIVEIS